MSSKHTSHRSSTMEQNDTSKANYIWPPWTNCDSWKKDLPREEDSTLTKKITNGCRCPRHHHGQRRAEVDVAAKPRSHRCSCGDGEAVPCIEYRGREVDLSSRRIESKRSSDHDKHARVGDSGFELLSGGHHRVCCHGRKSHWYRSPTKQRSMDRFYKEEEVGRGCVETLCRIHNEQNCYAKEIDAATRFSKKFNEWKQPTDRKATLTKARKDEARKGPESPVTAYIKQCGSRAQDSNPRGEACLQPSLVKAQQRKFEPEKVSVRSCQRCAPSRRSKASKPISPPPEQCKNIDGDEDDDEVKALRHKDSISILVEKFRTNDNLFGESRSHVLPEWKISESRTLPSDVTDRTDEDADRSEKNEENDVCRRRNCGCHRSYVVNKWSGARNRTFRENSPTYLRNLRSRLNRRGICCSPKGTSWRGTF